MGILAMGTFQDKNNELILLYFIDNSEFAWSPSIAQKFKNNYFLNPPPQLLGHFPWTSIVSPSCGIGQGGIVAITNSRGALPVLRN